MKLNNFENNISDVIFDRGESYYLSNAISELQELKNGKWLASVEGNYGDYEVNITFDNNKNITEYQCNCPHNADVCKHIVAVLLKIKDGTKSIKKEIASWEQIIDIIPEDELRKFVKKYAVKNKKFKNDFSIEFSEYDHSDNSLMYQEIVSDAFSMAKDQYGFIDYYHTSNAMSPIYDLLSKAEIFLKNKNEKEAFAIASAIPPKCIKAIQEMDDSNGECGDTINQSFSLILKIQGNSKNVELKRNIFNYLLAEANNKDYDDYGCADELEPILIDSADTAEKVKSTLLFINKKLEETSKETGSSGEYDTKKYLNFKANLFRKSGQDANAKKIILNNIHISDFRKIVVDEKIKEQNISDAIQLIKEGITIAKEKNNLKTIIEWKEKLLEIYQNQKDTKNVQRYAKELFFKDGYEMNFYKILKKTWNKELWNGEKENIIATIMRTYNNPTSYDYDFPAPIANIYIEEKMWQALFGIVNKSANLSILSTYSKYLKKDYAQEFVKMYRTAIKNYTTKSTGRSAYKTIVDYLKEMSKINGGKEAAKLLVADFLETHKNRPAMKDEFSKIKFL